MSEGLEHRVIEIRLSIHDLPLLCDFGNDNVTLNRKITALLGEYLRLLKNGKAFPAGAVIEGENSVSWATYKPVNGKGERYA